MNGWAIVYEDDELLLVDKVAGLPVLPERWEKEADCLYAQLATKYPSIATAHRIDKDTSGLILFVKTVSSARFMAAAFEKGQVIKRYLAIVQGRIPHNPYSCTLALRVDGNRKHQTVIDKRGQEARTDFLELERLGSWSLLEARLYTGRTHQVRVHAAESGFPLVADTFYGGKILKLSMIKRAWKGDAATERPLIQRVALHAWQLEFIHPSNGQVMSFKLEVPSDMQTTLKQLRQNT